MLSAGAGGMSVIQSLCCPGEAQGQVDTVLQAGWFSLAQRPRHSCGGSWRKENLEGKGAFPEGARNGQGSVESYRVQAPQGVPHEPGRQGHVTEGGMPTMPRSRVQREPWGTDKEWWAGLSALTKRLGNGVSDLGH
jgi:hypothetical protein